MTAGELVTTFTDAVPLETPVFVTATAAVPTMLDGAWKLIWPGLTNQTGAGVPLTRTFTPATVVGNPLEKSELLQSWVTPEKFAPYTETHEPGTIWVRALMAS